MNICKGGLIQLRVPDTVWPDCRFCVISSLQPVPARPTAYQLGTFRSFSSRLPLKLLKVFKKAFESMIETQLQAAAQFG